MSRPRPLHRTIAWGALLLAAAVVGCDDSATLPDEQDGTDRLRFVAGNGMQDTISAEPVQALVVQLTDSVGRPEVGVQVRFDAADDASQMLVAMIGGQSFLNALAAPTDAMGRASVRLRFLYRAGPGRIVVSVPIYNLVDTARFTVLPGRPVRAAAAPRDTGVAVGSSFALRGTTVDRAGNPRLDPADFLPSSSILSVDNAGRVTGRQIGRAHVRVQVALGSLPIVDSVKVAVVPVGQIAYMSNRNLALSDISGARNRILLNSGPVMPAWVPGGSRILIAASGTLAHVDTLGRLSPIPGIAVPDPEWAEYSRDGAWIYFQGMRSNVEGRQIFRVRPDGTGLTRISRRVGSMPSPSPDGTKVAYVNGYGDGALVIHDIATDTDRIFSSQAATSPRWSPDGNWIAYLMPRDGELMLMRPDGTGLKRIGEHGLFRGFSWSPDSRWIIGAEYGITLVDVNAGTMMYTGTGGDSPAWRR